MRKDKEMSTGVFLFKTASNLLLIKSYNATVPKDYKSDSCSRMGKHTSDILLVQKLKRASNNFKQNRLIELKHFGEAQG